MDLAKLKEPFPIERISWRCGARTKDKSKGIGLAYIDARDLYERLDEICGADGWQIRYPHVQGKTCCEIGINITKGQILIGEDGLTTRIDTWLWKANGSGDTKIEADKGAFSDAAKRAGVPWGIGAYLYDMPNLWVEIDQWGNIEPKEIARLQEALKLSVQRKAPPPDPKPDEVIHSDEDKWLVKDIRWLIRECDNQVDLDSLMDSIATDIERLHEDLQSDIYEAQAEVMGLIENDTFVQNNTYVFSGVPHGLRYGSDAKTGIEEAREKAFLEEWFARWMGKLRELDTVLSAAKYQTPEGSPYVRIQKLYADKLKELS